MLQEASPALERVFAPYNALLREIAGPRFGWSHRDHQKTPLSAEAKAAALEQARLYREHLRKRQVSTQLKERAKASQVRAAAKARGGGGLPAELLLRARQQRMGGHGRGRGRGRGVLPPNGLSGP